MLNKLVTVDRESVALGVLVKNFITQREAGEPIYYHVAKNRTRVLKNGMAPRVTDLVSIHTRAGGDELVPVLSLYRLFKSGRGQGKAKKLVDEYGNEIKTAYGKIKADVLSTTAVQAAATYYNAGLELMNVFYPRAWLLGRETVKEAVKIDDLARGVLDVRIKQDSTYLFNFAGELSGELTGLSEDEIGDLLRRRFSRAIRYKGGARAVWVEAQLHLQDPQALYYWSGGSSKDTCQTCAREVAAGPRPLAQISILPGRDSECNFNCVHSVERYEG